MTRTRAARRARATPTRSCLRSSPRSSALSRKERKPGRPRMTRRGRKSRLSHPPKRNPRSEWASARDAPSPRPSLDSTQITSRLSGTSRCGARDSHESKRRWPRCIRRGRRSVPPRQLWQRRQREPRFPLVTTATRLVFKNRRESRRVPASGTTGTIKSRRHLQSRRRQSLPRYMSRSRAARVRWWARSPSRWDPPAPRKMTINPPRSRAAETTGTTRTRLSLTRRGRRSVRLPSRRWPSPRARRSSSATIRSQHNNTWLQ